MSEKRLFEVLAGRMIEAEKPFVLSLDLHGEIRQDAAKRLATALSYFATTGRLPDPSVENLIRHHPLFKDDPKQEFQVCTTCEVLYDGQEACWRYMHPRVPLEDAGPRALDKILSILDRRHEEETKRRKVEARYPFPAERPDHSYLCQACRKSFTIQGSGGFSPHDYPEKRVVCSEWCKFDLLGRPRPEGRKRPGFVTLNPFFKGGQVFYFGEVMVPYRYSEKRSCECYLWNMVPGAKGYFYTYHGERENDLFHWVAGASANREEEEKIRVSGTLIEESWRILANVKDSYSWEVTP